MLSLLSEQPDLTIHEVDAGPEHVKTALRGPWPGKVRAFTELGGALESITKLSRIALRERFDVIHTDERPRDALAAVLIARLCGAKSIVHMHVDFGNWMSPILKFALSKADAIFAVSGFVKQSLEDAGYDPSRVHVLYNAIEPKTWNATPSRDEVRAEFSTPAGAPVVISVCRLQPGKGIGLLVEALPELKREFPQIRMWLVGEEQLTFAPGYPNALRARAAELGVQENLVLTGQRGDVARLMASADVYAMPSDREPFGLVYLEAMSSRLPVVANANGGVPEFISHGTHGLLIPPSDVGALTEALLTLLRDPAKRRAMGEAGRQHVDRAFALPRLAAHCEAHYLRLTSSAAGFGAQIPTVMPRVE